jgi:hypothetical protein
LLPIVVVEHRDARGFHQDPAQVFAPLLRDVSGAIRFTAGMLLRAELIGGARLE